MNRNANDLSIFNPPSDGDFVTVAGTVWKVTRGGYGWNLKTKAGEIHQRIRDIDGMADFIGAILEESK